MTHALILQCVGFHALLSHYTARPCLETRRGLPGLHDASSRPMPTDHPEESPHRQPHPTAGNPLPHLRSQPASTITSAHHAIYPREGAHTHTRKQTHAHTSHAGTERARAGRAHRPMGSAARADSIRAPPEPGATARCPQCVDHTQNPQGTQTMTDPHMVETWALDERTAARCGGPPRSFCPCCPSSAATGSPI